MNIDECFGYDDHRNCPLPDECEETNVCILHRLRNLRWIVERRDVQQIDFISDGNAVIRFANGSEKLMPADDVPDFLRSLRSAS